MNIFKLTNMCSSAVIHGVRLVSGLSRLVGGRRRRGLRHIGTRYTYRLPFAARCDDGDDIVDEWAKSVSGERVESSGGQVVVGGS